MRKRLASIVASSLAAFFLMQPAAVLALVELNAGADASCCKNACCCRRSHGKTNGAALTAAPGCGQACHVAVQNIGGASDAAVPATEHVAPTVVATVSVPREEQAVHSRTEAALYQRPPPSQA